MSLGNGQHACNFQVKYTNQSRSSDRTRRATNQGAVRDSMLSIRAAGATRGPADARRGCTRERACLSLDRIKREKGVWWMPWQQEAMKDVILCDKRW